MAFSLCLPNFERYIESPNDSLAGRHRELSVAVLTRNATPDVLLVGHGNHLTPPGRGAAKVPRLLGDLFMIELRSPNALEKNEPFRPGLSRGLFDGFVTDRRRHREKLRKAEARIKRKPCAIPLKGIGYPVMREIKSLADGYALERPARSPNSLSAEA
jgi:hypothetical protein